MSLPLLPQLQAVSDTLPSMIWIADPAGERVFFNSSWREFTGHSTDDQSRARWLQGVHPHDLYATVRSAQRAVTERRSFQLEHRLRRADGQYRWVLDRGAPWFDPAGELAGFVGVCVDVHEHRWAAEQVRLVQGLTARLACLEDRQEIARLVLEEAVTQLGGHTSSFCLLTSCGHELEIVADTGYSADVKDHWLRFPLDAPLPASDAVRENRTVLLRSPDERDALYPVFRSGPVVADRAYAVVPLSVPDARPIGAMVVGFKGPRDFSESDVEILESLATHAAVAIVRARLAEEAEAATERLIRLHQVAADLSGATTVDEVAAVVLGSALGELGCSQASLWLVNQPDDVLESVASAGQRDPPTPTGLPVDIDAAWQALLGGGQRIATDGRRALIVLRAQGVAVGALSFVWAEPQDFAQRERLLVAVADEAAQALERIRREELERARAARMRLLVEASRSFGASLEIGDTLATVVDQLSRHVGDLAVVCLPERSGRLMMAAGAHRDPQKAALLECLKHRAVAEGSCSWEVFRTGQTRVVAADDEAFFSEPMTLEDGPAVVVPLPARGEIVGVMAVRAGRGRPPFSAEEVELVEEIGRRASVAIDNARLFESRAAITTALQRSLLPPALPVIAGVELAARYQPAADGLDVGGDFYDIYPLGAAGDTWAVMVGDVVGNGAEAAAITSLVRHSARAIGRYEGDARAIVVALNQVLLETGDEGDFCTLAYGHLRASAAGLSLQLVSAGHPPALVVRFGGEVEEVGVGGCLLGSFEQIDLVPVDIDLAPGDSVVLFTDGVIEARAGHERPARFFGFGGVKDALIAQHRADPDAMAGALVAAALDFARGRIGDDVAVLVVRAALTAPAAPTAA